MVGSVLNALGIKANFNITTILMAFFFFLQVRHYYSILYFSSL